jgi:hypothetical protein
MAKKPFFTPEEAQFHTARVLEAMAEFNAEYGEAFRTFREFGEERRARENQAQPADEDQAMEQVLAEASRRRIQWQEKQ